MKNLLTIIFNWVVIYLWRILYGTPENTIRLSDSLLICKSCRCSSIVTDPYTHRPRKCKLNFKFSYNCGKFCHVHAKIILANYATLIQKIWKRYYTSKKLNSLFIPLPRDLQLKILFYIQEPDLIKKYHHKPIKKIVSKKLNNINLSILFINGPPYSAYQKYKALISGAEILRLVNKYFEILDFNVIDQLDLISKHIRIPLSYYGAQFIDQYTDVNIYRLKFATNLEEFRDKLLTM